MIIHAEVSAVSATGGTYKRFCDYGGLAMINYVQISYGSNRLARFTREDLYDKAINTKERKELYAWRKLIGGNMSNAERDNAATGPQTFGIEIPTWWTEDIRYWYPAQTMSAELTIEVMWENCANSIQTDGTAPQYTITTQELHLVQSHLINKDRASILAKSRSGNGILYKMIVPNRQIFRITTGVQNPQELAITNLKGATTMLRTYMRAISDCESTTSANDFFRYQKIDSYDFEGNGIKYYDGVTDAEMKFLWWPKFHKGEPGINVYDVVHCLNPDDYINSTGSLNYGLLGNKIFRCYWSKNPTPSVPMRFDCVAFENNVVQLYYGDANVVFK